MTDPVSRLIKWAKGINDTIWLAPVAELSRRKSFLIKQVRIMFLAARGFANHKVQLRASALTLYTLLSIIPILAIGFAIAKGFGLDQNLEAMILSSKEFSAQKDVLKFLLESARNAIQETRGGYMAGIGVIILFWSVMSLLNDIENSFNHIWQISASRPWYRKFTDYLTIMLIAPVFIILSGSITVFIGTELTDFISRAPILAFFKPVVSFLIRFSPYFLTWFTMTVLFIIMPNAKVKFLPALVSGIITGTFLQLLLWLYIDLQFGISKLSAIYGSFAAVPLLILWLQASWIIVLLGAELTFANQNIAQYDLEAEALSISYYQRRGLSLLIMNLIIRNFAVGDKPLSSEEIGRMLKMPVRLVRDILKDLKSINLVTEISVASNIERFYQPSIDINLITVSFMIEKLDRMGVENKMIIRSKDYGRITTLLDKFEKTIAKTGNEILVKDI